MSINATALYPWLQTPTVEKYPPENKILKIERNLVSAPGLQDFTVFNKSFGAGGILSHVILGYVQSPTSIASSQEMEFRGHKVTINGETEQDFSFSTGSIFSAFIYNEYGSAYRNNNSPIILPFNMRFTESLLLKLRINPSGSSFLVSYAFYYEL